ncbi:MAG: extracellular solute-binding protein [Clostridium butyricum]|nr:extracellular solute-binding protein [Clostridium butyricum]
MKKKVLAMILSAMTVLSFAGCGGGSADSGAASSDAGGESKNLIVYCPHPVEFIDPLVNEFESQTGVEVEVVTAGTGELLKRVESEGDNPLGDIFWGGSLSTLQPKVDLFEEYKSANEDAMVEDYKNKDGHITRFSVIPSVIMVNTNLIGDIKVEGFQDLLNPELKGKIANADPSKSSSALEHLINQLYAMGNGNPDDGWDYVTELTKNLDGKLLSGSSAVYKGVADGEYTVGLTFEEAAVKYAKDGAPVKVIYPSEGTIAKADGVAIIKGAKNMDNAKKFIDFVTSKEAQTVVATELNRRSVRNDVVGEGLEPFENIKMITDDETWVNSNKQVMLDKYKDIITSN